MHEMVHTTNQCSPHTGAFLQASTRHVTELASCTTCSSRKSTALALPYNCTFSELLGQDPPPDGSPYLSRPGNSWLPASQIRQLGNFLYGQNFNPTPPKLRGTATLQSHSPFWKLVSHDLAEASGAFGVEKSRFLITKDKLVRVPAAA